jgi:hypothetical protein
MSFLVPLNAASCRSAPAAMHASPTRRGRRHECGVADRVDPACPFPGASKLQAHAAPTTRGLHGDMLHANLDRDKLRCNRSPLLPIIRRRLEQPQTPQSQHHAPARHSGLHSVLSGIRRVAIGSPPPACRERPGWGKALPQAQSTPPNPSLHAGKGAFSPRPRGAPAVFARCRSRILGATG